MENIDKKKIIILVLGFMIIIAFNIYRNIPSIKLKEYISNRGFILEDDETFYYRKISNNTKEKYEEDKKNNINSNYDYLYFDIYNNKLNEEINEYNDKYETSLNINYSFPTNNLEFIYRIHFDNKTNIIFKGKYDEQEANYICEKEFSNEKIEDNIQKDFCENASYYVDSFVEIKNKIFQNKKIVKYLEKSK